MTELVVDLGCERHNRDYSIEPLIKRFAPEFLFGFDPACASARYGLLGTEVVIDGEAAWVHGGTVQFSGADDEATAMNASSAWNGDQRAVPCFDFSAWLGSIKTPEVIVKMDIEGAEVPVLEKIIEDGTDDRISLLLVEWHDSHFNASYTLRRAAVEEFLRCPVEVWH